jgi:hypothetical protein
MNEKLIEFLRTKPPTFGGSVNPLDADDWLRAILRELEPFNCEDRDKVLLATHQLTGTALAWWENYCAAAKDPSAITWDEFVVEFRRYHIPEATLKRKADEFRELRQGNKSVEEYTYQFIELARYAPEEVDKNSKKQEMFKKGLTLELRTLLTTQIYPDFQHPHEHVHPHRESQGRREEGEQVQVHGAQGSTARALPEAEKLQTPHVQVPSPHAVPNPVPSHGLSRPQNPVQTIQQP